MTGTSFTADNSASHAFITGPNGVGMIDLGTLGGTSSYAHSINNSGQVVGLSYIADGSSHPFIFSNGGMTDLLLLPSVVKAGWNELIAIAINDNGQIVGYGKLASDPDHLQAFLLSFSPDTAFTPNPIFIPTIPPIISTIPEPQTYAMLLAGLGLLGFMARRRKESVE